MKTTPTDSVFETAKPNLQKSEIDEILKNNYGISADQTSLVSERDQNVKLTTDAGDFVLKISNIAEDSSFLELQNQAFSYLENFAPYQLAPKLIKGINNDNIFTHQNDQGLHQIRLLSYLQGKLYDTENVTPKRLKYLGEFLGVFSKTMTGFNHPAAHRRGFLWNLDNALNCKAYIKHIKDNDDKLLVSQLFEDYESTVIPKLGSLRSAVLHQDANENNLLVSHTDTDKVTGIIDFGDMCFGRQINEIAIAMAYALQEQTDLYTASRQIISGYVKHFPLVGPELDVLFGLIQIRLAMSVCISSKRSLEHPDNDYLTISQKPALRLLSRMRTINPCFMTAVYRKAAGFPVTRNYRVVFEALNDGSLKPAPMFDIDLKRCPRRIINLDASIEVSRVREFKDLLTPDDIHQDIRYLVGLYGENRSVYSTDQFKSSVTLERRTVHLGQDIFIPAGYAVYSPLAARVFSVVDNDFPLDYGPTVILEHPIENTDTNFYTLYGHLSNTALDLLTPGQEILPGQLIGHIGEFEENGGWAPHLHFQLITDMLDLNDNFNGVGEKSLWPVYKELCPDPNLILRLSPETFNHHAEPASLLEPRQQLLGPSLSLSYRKKLNIVRGKGAYLYDNTGREYLDCVNNICHVGHCHEHVVEALQKQAALLNTNTRYLHQTTTDYAKRLTDLCPDPLSVVYFVNSGTEANELALRIARTATGVKETIVLDWAYHGNSTATVEISPYKFKRGGGFEKPLFVEIAQFPDPYRGEHPAMDDSSALAYADSVALCVQTIHQRTGHGPACFIAESISGVGGQVVYPDRYLEHVYKIIRAAGGVCIADEVQCGFGRVGSHFWAFESQNVVPDIMVLGKPMGNGHPLAAVITTKELAKKFANGMEYFNSFGGNPVSTSVGMAVLDVIENEGLMQHAKEIGDYLINGFNVLKNKHYQIGDVRGRGLFLGLELVSNRETKSPASQLASDIVNDLRENSILLSTDGPDDNVLKFKPPMVFSLSDSEFLLNSLDAAFEKRG